MAIRANKTLLTFGIVLLCCLPLCVGVAVGVAKMKPKQYYSKVTFEARHGVDLLQPRTDHGALLGEVTQAFEKLAQRDGNAAQLRQVKNTNLFEIGVYDADSQAAAQKANTMVVSLRENLQEAAQRAQSTPGLENQGVVFRIWEKAEASALPARPNVFAIMLLGGGIGAALGLLGLLLVIVALIVGRSDSRAMPQAA